MESSKAAAPQASLPHSKAAPRREDFDGNRVATIRVFKNEVLHSTRADEKPQGRKAGPALPGQ
jgi:hypothetical protein